MNISGNSYHTIWPHPRKEGVIQIIDQRYLPHEFVIADLTHSDEAATAIQEMWVRGAPLIGATAAWGYYLAVREADGMADSDAYLHQSKEKLLATRPTAINLAWALDRMKEKVTSEPDWPAKEQVARAEAAAIVAKELDACEQIGNHGLPLIEALYAKHQRPINILTHCNAGWLACIDWGTATAPIYKAFNAGIPVHVWVDETRPRNQGARITAWELAQHGVPHTVIPDNTGGHLMQHGQVDLCLVGSDRTTLNGDVANKIGTYLKALAAHDNGVPFYVALPSSSIDFSMEEGLGAVPIEQRNQQEVTHIWGWDEDRNERRQVRLTPAESPAANYAFDVTPARLVTGLITEKGLCPATHAGITSLSGLANQERAT